jgi:CRP-like cAMP-binding protein
VTVPTLTLGSKHLRQNLPLVALLYVQAKFISMNMPDADSSYFESLMQHIERRVELKDEEKNYIRSSFSVRKLLARQYLVAQGEVCRHESYVTEGFLRSFYVDSAGKEHTLHFAQEDWWITDLQSFLLGTPASRTIVAVEPCVVLQIDLKHREELIGNVPAMERFWRILNEKACIAQEQRILQNISMSGLERYQALLEKYPQIEQRLAQKYIASFLGMTPVFLSQIRKELAQK